MTLLAEIPWDDLRNLGGMLLAGGAFGAVVVAFINARAAKPVNEATAAEMSVRGMNHVVGAWELFTKKMQDDMDKLRTMLDGLQVELDTLEDAHSQLKSAYADLRREHVQLQREHDVLTREYNVLKSKPGGC